MKHPFEFLPQHTRKPLFYFFFALTLFIFGIFNMLDQRLKTEAAPNGIVSFEMARNVDLSQRIINSWNADARLAAAFGLGFDYLFMPVYALALSLGLILARENKPLPYQSLAALMGWGALLAAIFDTVENYALWHILMHDAESPYPQVATICATIKFTLLLLGLVTIIAGKIIRK